MPHRTTRGPARRGSGPWLTSFVMWANFLRFVPVAGRPLPELRAAARTTNLAGLQRWGYVRMEDDTVQLRPDGRLAVETWAPIEDEVVSRWRERFGERNVTALMRALRPFAVDV